MQFHVGLRGESWSKYARLGIRFRSDGCLRHSVTIDSAEIDSLKIGEVAST